VYLCKKENMQTEKTKSTKKAKPTNKVLNQILEKISVAKENKQKSVVVYTTSAKDYKVANVGAGFGSSDLKPKLLEAYKTIFSTYDVSTECVNLEEMAIQWVVKVK